jgi:hypothetical protein
MNVKLMKVLSTKDLDAELFGVKIQLSPRRCVYVAEGNHLFSTTSKDLALLKLKEVQNMLEADPQIIKNLQDAVKVKVIIM